MLHWLKQLSAGEAVRTIRLSKECEELRTQLVEASTQMALYEQRLGQLEAAQPLACDLLHKLEAVTGLARKLVAVAHNDPAPAEDVCSEIVV